MLILLQKIPARLKKIIIIKIHPFHNTKKKKQNCQDCFVQKNKHNLIFPHDTKHEKM